MTNSNTEESEVRLEPCPFCGRNAKIEAFQIDDDPQWWFVATCVVCPIKTYDQFSAEEAAEIWNSHASVVAPQPELMTDAALRAAMEFHRAEAARYSNEGAKVWRLRVRMGHPAPGDEERAAALTISTFVPAASVTTPVSTGERLAAIFTELYNCYTASKCAATDREEHLRLRGMAEAYQDAAKRCSEFPAQRRNDGTVVSAAPATTPDGEQDALVDEVQRRMDHVVETAVEWHQAGREGGEWFEAAEKLGAAIESLLELRDKPLSAEMPRRRCAVHQREEFRYESLQHELDVETARAFDARRKSANKDNPAALRTSEGENT